MRKLAKTLDLSDIKNKRFIVIGDLHGCFDQLIELLQKCNYNKDKDIIVATGDLCDRGNNSLDVLKFFMPDNPHQYHNIYTVLGNHCDKFKRYLLGNKIKIGKPLQKTIDEFSVKCISDLEKGAIALWLNALPHIIRIPDLNNKPCYVVHAGFSPDYPPEKQSIESCLYIRGINPKNYFSKEGGLWYDYLNGDYIIISGHIVSEIIQPNPAVFCLDGGCVHGGVLRAIVIDYTE